MAYICGRNCPNQPAIVGLCGTVVDADTPITTGPHARSNTYERMYKPTRNAQHKFCKIIVTRAAPGLLATLPYPRLNVLCNSCTAGDVLWLPLARIREADCDESVPTSRDDTNTVHLELFHQSTTCSDNVDGSDSPCPFSQLEDLARLSLVPNGEVERHIEVVWELLTNRLNAIEIGKEATSIKLKRVQADIFHLMKRPRPRAKHSFLEMYAQALSYAFFVRDVTDEARVFTALTRRDFAPSEIRMLLLKNATYATPRVRRKLRPPSVLAAWLHAIFMAFGPLLCTKTKKQLLPRNELAKAVLVIEDVKAGFVGDIDGLQLYDALYTPGGNERRDRDGIRLRSCARGTNDCENVHQKLINSMNNMWGAGSRTTAAMLLKISTRHNERMLCRRVAYHENDVHMNFILSSYIEKYEEIAFPENKISRSNANVLDFKWIPLHANDGSK